MTRDKAKEILQHWDDAEWREENLVTMGEVSDAINLAGKALGEPTQEQYIDKACEWLKDQMHIGSPEKTGNIYASTFLSVTPDFLGEFRKAMTEKSEFPTNPWHKVSDKLPPIDTEVVCKMKGVPHTEHFVCKWDGRYWLHWAYFGQDIQGWFGLNDEWEVVEWKEI